MGLTTIKKLNYLKHFQVYNTLLVWLCGAEFRCKDTCPGFESRGGCGIGAVSGRSAVSAVWNRGPDCTGVGHTARHLRDAAMPYASRQQRSLGPRMLQECRLTGTHQTVIVTEAHLPLLRAVVLAYAQSSLRADIVRSLCKLWPRISRKTKLPL